MMNDNNDTDTAPSSTTTPIQKKKSVSALVRQVAGRFKKKTSGKDELPPDNSQQEVVEEISMVNEDTASTSTQKKHSGWKKFRQKSRKELTPDEQQHQKYRDVVNAISHVVNPSKENGIPDWQGLFKICKDGKFHLRDSGKKNDTVLHHFCEVGNIDAIQLLVDLGAKLEKNADDEWPIDVFPPVKEGNKKAEAKKKRAEKIFSQYRERTAKGISELEWLLSVEDDSRAHAQKIRCIMYLYEHEFLTEHKGKKISKISSEDRHKHKCLHPECITLAIENGHKFYIKELHQGHLEKKEKKVKENEKKFTTPPIQEWNFNSRFRHEKTLLDVAERCEKDGDETFVRYLLDETQIDLNQRNAFQAAKIDDHYLLKKWLEGDKESEKPSRHCRCDEDSEKPSRRCIQNGETLLHVAVHEGSSRCINLLLPRKTQDDERKGDDERIEEDIKFLVEYKDAAGLQAIDWGIMSGRTDILSRIMTNTNHPPIREKTLKLAARKGCTLVLKHLFQEEENQPKICDMNESEKANMIHYIIDQAARNSQHNVLKFLFEETDTMPLDKHDRKYVWRRDKVFRHGLVHSIGIMLGNSVVGNDQDGDPLRNQHLHLCKLMVDEVSKYNKDISMDMIKLIPIKQFNDKGLQPYEQQSIYVEHIPEDRRKNCRILCVCFGSELEAYPLYGHDKDKIIKKYLKHRAHRGSEFDYIWTGISCIPPNDIGFSLKQCTNWLTALFLCCEVLIVPPYYEAGGFFCTDLNHGANNALTSQVESVIMACRGCPIFIAFHSKQSKMDFQQVESAVPRFYNFYGRERLRFEEAKYKKEVRRCWVSVFCELEDIAVLAINTIWENPNNYSKFLSMSIEEKDILEGSMMGLSGPSLKKLYDRLGNTTLFLPDKTFAINQLLCFFCYVLQKFKSTGSEEIHEQRSLLSILMCKP